MKNLEKAKNRELNLREFASGLVELKSSPRFVVVELTRGCNLRCPMCRADTISTKGNTMTPELFDLVADALFPMAEMIDLRGWGESLILPNITEKMDRAARSGAELRLVTNLSFQRDSALRALALYNAFVSVSVDTAEPELFSRIRAGGRLDLVEKNIKMLSSSYIASHGSAERLVLSCIVQRPALNELWRLAEFAERCGVSSIRLFAVSAAEMLELSLDGLEDEVNSSVDRLSEEARKRGISLQLGTKLGRFAPNVSNSSMACIHPWAYCYVSYSGKMGFCDHVIGPSGDPYVMGDLVETRWEKIWNSQSWQDLRKEHLGERRKHAPLFEECAWCYKNRFVEFEDWFAPEFAAHRKYI